MRGARARLPALSTTPIAMPRLDSEADTDRLVLAYSEHAGWSFGCAEQFAAPIEVQAALNDHEAISYRPRDDYGRSRHEFPAMVAELVRRLGGARRVGESRVGVGVHVRESVSMRMGVRVCSAHERLQVRARSSISRSTCFL